MNRNRNWIIAGLVVLALIIAVAWLGGCFNNAEPVAAAPTATKAAEPPARATPDATAAYKAGLAVGAEAVEATPNATAAFQAGVARGMAAATAAPTRPTVDAGQFAEQSVDAAMAAAGFKGTAEQEAGTRENLLLVANPAAEQMAQAGYDLNDENVRNEFVGKLVEQAIHNGLFCWAQNMGPENETESGGAQRMEVTTGGLMHLDYYRGPGVPSVSILVRAGEAAVLKGYGSRFEFPWDRCGGFDFVADAQKYAEGRRDWGHSGVVFNTLHDALNGDPTVNLWGLSSAQIDGLRPIIWEENPEQLAAVRAVTGATVDEREQACGAARPEPFNSTPDTEWVVDASDGPTIVEFWSNWPDLQTADKTVYYMLVHEGQTVRFRGGGTAYHFESGCQDVAQSQLKLNPNDGFSWDSYIIK